MKLRLFPIILTTLLTLPLHAQERPRLGVALPTSGTYAPIGKQLAEAARLAGRDVKIEVVVADTEGTPEGAARAIRELETKNVVAIVGPVGRRESASAATTAQRLSVPMFALGGDRSIEVGKGWVFRARWSPGEQARAAAEMAFRDRGARKAAVLFPENEFGREASARFAERFRELGGEVVALSSYDEDTTNFKWPLRELVGETTRVGRGERVGKRRGNRFGFIRTGRRANVHFDTLFIADSHLRVARLLPFLPTVGIQNGDGGDGKAVQLIGVAAWRGKAMELSKGVASGAIILDTFGGEAVGGRAEEFSRTFQESTGRRPTSIEAEVFDLVWMLGSLIQDLPESPKSRRPNLVRALPRERTWNGVAGGLRFDPNGGPVRKPIELRFDVDGQVVPTR